MPKPITIPDAKLDEIRDALAAAPYGRAMHVMYKYTDELGCSEFTIRHKLRERHGCQRRRMAAVRLSDEQLLHACQSHETSSFGQSTDTIEHLAKRYGCSAGTLRRKMREFKQNHPAWKTMTTAAPERTFSTLADLADRTNSSRMATYEKEVLRQIEHGGYQALAELAVALSLPEAPLRTTIHHLQNRNAIRHAGGKVCLVRFTVSPSYAILN